MIVILIVLLSSCSSLSVLVKSSDPALKSITSLAFVETGFSERILPVLPLLDAGIYNSAVKNAAVNLFDVEEAATDKLNSIFPTVLKELSSGDITTVENPFGTEDFSLFDIPDTFTLQKIKDIAKETSTDAVVLCTIRVETTGVSAFGINGASFVRSNVYIYSKEGTLLAEGQFVSETVTAGPSSVSGYENLLNQCPGLVQQLLEAIYA